MKAINVIKNHANEIDKLLGENYIEQLLSFYLVLTNKTYDHQKELEIEKYFHFFISKSNLVDIKLIEAAGFGIDLSILDELNIPTEYHDLYNYIRNFLEKDISDNFKSACEFTMVFNTFVKLVYPYVTLDENDI